MCSTEFTRIACNAKRPGHMHLESDSLQRPGSARYLPRLTFFIDKVSPVNDLQQTEAFALPHRTGW
jgi:hypothetical protein